MIDLELDFRSKHDWYTDRLTEWGWLDADGRTGWELHRTNVCDPRLLSNAPGMLWPGFAGGLVLTVPPGGDVRWLEPSFAIGPDHKI